jgi:hypothetical protein
LKPAGENMAAKSASRRCDECGALVPEDAREGLCPRCLLQTAMLAGANGESEMQLVGEEAVTSPERGPVPSPPLWRVHEALTTGPHFREDSDL